VVLEGEEPVVGGHVAAQFHETGGDHPVDRGADLSVFHLGSPEFDLTFRLFELAGGKFQFGGRAYPSMRFPPRRRSCGSSP
jgi:hypothetical protein